MTAPLPKPFQDWFAAKGWQPHAHQIALLEGAVPGSTQLLIAPTGGGKTLAGFLPSLVELTALQSSSGLTRGSREKGKDPRVEREGDKAVFVGLHTLYISPLKALAADIRRNLEAPIAEMNLAIRVEDRTGDTKQSQRVNQRRNPPQILLTTPESLVLLLADARTETIFANLRAVVVDEAHALAPSKRGDQLALCLARLRRLAPDHHRIGLSATVRDPGELATWLSPPSRPSEAQSRDPLRHDQGGPGSRPGRASNARPTIIRANPGPDPDIAILDTRRTPPWSSMNARYAAPDVMATIEKTQTAIVFINTRAQSELFFQALWSINDDDLPIGLHHGSLAKETRAKVEAAMATGQLRAVVSTSSLDMGIDWAAVDLVVQVGAPKGVARLIQRIGRANHRLDEPSRALLVPANRFDLIECRAAVEAVRAGEVDGEPLPPGGLDVLCQHILLMACTGPFDAGELYAEILGAGPYHALSREDFDRCLDYCATGGYALRAYDRWKRLMERNGKWQLRDPRTARRIRMNVGTIVEAETLGVKVSGRRGGGFKLGEVEEAFAATLRPGDSFMIGGEVVLYKSIREMTVQVERGGTRDPKVPVFAGSRMPISTALADRVIAIMGDPARWSELPQHTQDWLCLQSDVSRLPQRNRLLIESFPCADRHHTVFWSFAGRNAHQTLGLIVTKRMEEAGLAPLGFVANDYALMIWGLDPIDDPAALMEADGLRTGLDRWLTDSSLMKRTFRTSAVIAGLIERRFPGMQKSGRQATVSSDVLYDTLVKYDPDHLMLDITRREAMRGMVDFDRIEDLIDRTRGRSDHVKLSRLSPLSAPLMMEVGRERVAGSADERLLMESLGVEDVMEALA